MHPFVHSIFDGRGAWSLHCYSCINDSTCSQPDVHIWRLWQHHLSGAFAHRCLWKKRMQLCRRKKRHTSRHLVPKVCNMMVPWFFFALVTSCHLLLLFLLDSPTPLLGPLWFYLRGHWCSNQSQQRSHMFDPRVGGMNLVMEYNRIMWPQPESSISKQHPTILCALASPGQSAEKEAL